MTTNELWGKDRAGIMERMGRMLGSTTYRDGDSGGGAPFSSRKLTTEAGLLLAIKMGGTHPKDVGPWIVYSIALKIDDRQRQIVEWLAGKLERGTGVVGKRNGHRMLMIAVAAYNLAVHGVEPRKTKVLPNEFEALVNIGVAGCG